MSRTPRDRDAERTAILAAIDRLLAGTPLRSTTGKLTATELITESGLRRDVLYEHADLVNQFKARVKAQHSTPVAMQELADKHTEALAQLAAARRDLAEERRTTALLRKAIAELSLELEQAHSERAETTRVTRLPSARQRLPPGAR
jgi:hypothetical protein